MSTPDRVTIVCVPEAWSHLPDATKHKCDKCGGGIWVAPSSWQLLKRYPDAEFLCHTCATRQIEEAVIEGDEVEFKIAPGAREEFRRDMEQRGWNPDVEVEEI